mgnify:FL=1
MISSDKIVNKFYRDYKNLHNIIEYETAMDKQEVARMLNIEIINAFLSSEEMKKYQEYLKEIKFTNQYNKGDGLKTNFVNDKINAVIHKYDWSINNKSEGEITPDILGNVLEKYINKRENGAYYTSNDTINFILNNSIYRYMIKEVLGKDLDHYKNLDELMKVFWFEVKTMSHTEVDYIINKLKSVKIADISVGTGAFLVNLIDFLFIMTKRLYTYSKQEFKSEKILFNILENNIFGMDIMNDAVEIAKFRIIIKAIQIMINENTNSNMAPTLNILAGNSLLVDNLQIVFNKRITAFDIIIGNPPYIEYSKIKNYEIENFRTIKTGNVYAFMIEKSVELLRDGGTIGLVVPISIVSTIRMKKLRDFLYDKSEEILFVNFSDRPGTLFNGVHQKLSIVFIDKGKSETTITKTTSYKHWYESEREKLFTSTNFYKLQNFNETFIPKVEGVKQESLLNKLIENDDNLLDITNKNGLESLSLSLRLTFWAKCFIRDMDSSEYKVFHFKNKKERDLFYLIINSDIFFFVWETISDGWHITNKELKSLKFNKDKMDVYDEKDLASLVKELENDLEKNKEYIGSRQTEFVYKHKKSKNIIDKINEKLAFLFDLTKEEVYFLQNYNLKYRMNDELLKYQKSKMEEK